MKKSIYLLFVTALMAGLVLASCGANQTQGAYKDNTKYNTEVDKTKAKLDPSKVPSEVTRLFYADYPATTSSDWYGHPGFDYSHDWYDYDPDLYITDTPETYVAEFTTDSLLYKAVYTKAGKKVAVHKVVSTLPAAVSSAISNSDYKDWTIGKEKEEIYKDKDADVLQVYKVHIEMGNQKHTLYFRPDGTLMKDKKVV